VKKILLDTQALLWIRADHPGLSKKAKNAYRKKENEVFVSVVSFWELAIKKSLGKIEMTGTLKEFIDSAFERLGLSLLPLTLDHILKVDLLPFHHRDPFDRILAAQALCEGMEVVAGDSEFDKYGVKRIW
jgi:PIN domain nuclease of toxin-antitoxin system